MQSSIRMILKCPWNLQLFLNQHLINRWVSKLRQVIGWLVWKLYFRRDTFALPCLRQASPNFNPSLVCMIRMRSGSEDLFFLAFVFVGTSGTADNSSPSMTADPWVRCGINWRITSEADVYENRHTLDSVISWRKSSPKWGSLLYK
jgi:hypothetical protein